MTLLGEPRGLGSHVAGGMSPGELCLVGSRCLKLLGQGAKPGGTCHRHPLVLPRTHLSSVCERGRDLKARQGLSSVAYLLSEPGKGVNPGSSGCLWEAALAAGYGYAGAPRCVHSGLALTSCSHTAVQHHKCEGVAGSIHPERLILQPLGFLQPHPPLPVRRAVAELALGLSCLSHCLALP